MRKIFILLLLIIAIVSCSKKSDNTTSSYVNKITLGTGFSSTSFFELTGVGTTFPASSNIFFRLESVDDMAGSTVRINIDKQDGTPFDSQDYPNPQSYGHILLSNFMVDTPGSYKATGILLTGNKTVASINFIIN